MVSFCNVDELTNLTGTSLSATVQQDIIDQSDREIKARLLLADITAPASDDSLKAASLNLSIAGVMTRHRVDGTKPASIKVGDISMSDNIDAGITQLTNRAWQSVDSYIKSNGTLSRDKWYLRKVNR